MVTVSISRVGTDELNLVKTSRIEDVLKEKVSGVQITQSSEQPGFDSKIRIRSIGTVNNSNPLFIVDGMAVDGNVPAYTQAQIDAAGKGGKGTGIGCNL